jgi:hypothetical protein
MADAMDVLEVRLQQITHVDRLDQKYLLQLSLVLLFSSIAEEYYEDHVGLKSDVLDIRLNCQPLRSRPDTGKCNFISSCIKYSIAIRPMQTCNSDLGLFTQVVDELGNILTLAHSWSKSNVFTERFSKFCCAFLYYFFSVLCVKRRIADLLSSNLGMNKKSQDVKSSVYDGCSHDFTPEASQSVLVIVQYEMKRY